MVGKLLVRYIPFLLTISVSASRFFGKVLLYLSKGTLDLFGYESILDGMILRIGESNGVTIVKGCLAYFLISVFIGFIIVYPGNRKSKYWFIPLGLVILIILNSLRISGMVLVSYYNQENMHIYHRFVFKTILHLSVLVLWIIWVSKYGEKMISKNNL